MLTYLWYLLAVSFGVTAAWGQFLDVCIIGAGPAGIQAAYTAESKGMTVAVFEKNSFVGGQTKSIFVPNSEMPYIMGAAIHVAAKHSSIKKLFKEFDVQPIMRPYYDQETAFFNSEGDIVDVDAPVLRVLLAAKRYFLKRGVWLKRLDGPEGYLSHYNDKKLHMSFGEWLDNNHLSALRLITWGGMTLFGFGDVDDVPAIYGLKYYSGRMMLDAILSRYTRIGGQRIYNFQELLEKMTNRLQGKVYLSANITDVDYGEGSTSLTYILNEDTTPTTTQCKSTVIAFAPSIAAMEKFIPPDFAQELKALISQVHFHNFYSVLLDDSDKIMSSGGRQVRFLAPFSELPNDSVINTVYWKQQDFPESSVSAYCWLKGQEKTNEAVLMEALTIYGSLVGSLVNASAVQEFIRWEYFPHASKESLDAGFFEKFDALQGKGQQYYTGALFNFDMVQDAMEHAEYIINRFF
jgi:hypothetical protein